jgi:hypothetical protein
VESLALDDVPHRDCSQGGEVMPKYNVTVPHWSGEIEADDEDDAHEQGLAFASDCVEVEEIAEDDDEEEEEEDDGV